MEVGVQFNQWFVVFFNRGIFLYIVIERVNMSNLYQLFEDLDLIIWFVILFDVNFCYFVGSKDCIWVYEVKYGLEFLESYVQFFSRENGLQYMLDLEIVVEWMLDEKLIVGWLVYVNVFFGIGNENFDLDFEIFVLIMIFYDYEVMFFVYLIVIGEDVMIMVEI